jgi:NitT/TauT family transport system permease protein
MTEAGFSTIPAESDHDSRLLARAVRETQQARRRSSLRILCAQGLLLLAMLAVWQIASGRWVDALFFSDPLSVSQAFVRIVIDGSLWWHLEVTLVEMALGYTVGVVAGVVMAFVVSLIPFGKPIVRPMMLMAFSTPKVALAPLIIIWFGIGLLPKVILAASLVFFVVYFNTLVGISATDVRQVSMMRLMSASRMAIFRKVILPNSVPYIVTAMRITLPAALIGAIIGEFISSNRGIGYLIAAASSRYDTAQVFAGIVSLLVFVLILNAGVSLLERRLLSWRPPVRQVL